MKTPENVLLQLGRQLPVTCDPTVKAAPQSCLNSIIAALFAAAAALGYENVRYTCWLKHPENQDAGVGSFSVNISNCPVVWDQLYNSRQLYLIDPVVRVIQENFGQKNLIHGFWQDAYDDARRRPQGDTPAQKQDYARNVEEFIQLAHQNGICSGYYYAWANNRIQIIMSLGSSRQAVDMGALSVDEYMRAIHSMVSLVNQALSLTQGCARCDRSLRINGNEPVRLTQPELEILQLFQTRRNATIKQVARRYGRSVDTVNYHLRSLRKKFQAPGASGHSLAAYAAEHKLI